MRIQIHNGRLTGSILLTAVVFSGILGMALAGFLALANHDIRLTTRSQEWNLCMPVLEAGIEEALTHCYYNWNGTMTTADWELGTNGYTKTGYLTRGDANSAQGKNEGYYQVNISLTFPYVITATGYMYDNATGHWISRTVRISTVKEGVFTGILSIRDSLDMNGNPVYADSYDSRDPAKSTGGFYDPLKAGDKADVHCTDGLLDSVNIGNAKLWGHVFTGPTGKLTYGAQGKVGSVAFQQDDSIKSGVEIGWWQNDYNSALPSVKAPFAVAPAPSGGIVNGTNYNYILPGGNYMLSSVAGGKVLIAGKVVLYVTGSVDLSGNNDVLEFTPGSSLEIYIGGQYGRFGAVETPVTVATDLKIFGLPTNTEMKLSGSRNFYGLIYAPQATFEIKGGVHYYGAFCVKSARLMGSCNFHYDEALFDVPPFRGFIISDWEEI